MKSFIPLRLSMCGSRVNYGKRRGLEGKVPIMNKDVCCRGRRQGKKNGMLVISDEKKSYIIQMQTKKFSIMIEPSVAITVCPGWKKMARDLLEIFLGSFPFRIIFLLLQIASENHRSLASVCRCVYSSSMVSFSAAVSTWQAGAMLEAFISSPVFIFQGKSSTILQVIYAPARPSLP